MASKSIMSPLKSSRNKRFISTGQLASEATELPRNNNKIKTPCGIYKNLETDNLNTEASAPRGGRKLRPKSSARRPKTPVMNHFMKLEEGPGTKNQSTFKENFPAEI